MMKKTWNRILSLGAAAILSVSALAGCSDLDQLGDALGNVTGGGVEIDESKSQLYVYNFNGGFGSEWLTKLAEAYEAKTLADGRSFESGKTGVQVIPTNQKSGKTGTDIKNGQEMVYFIEQVDLYADLVANNAVADISAAVTGENYYESGKTLESKMYDDQKSYFGVSSSDGTKYYGYPHYFTSFGIVYDIDLFDAKGYYFRKDRPAKGEVPDAAWLGLQFLGTEKVAKSAGPDGREGTDDDGLPATYEEFFLLCDYIKNGATPMVWTGQYYSGYMSHLYNSLVAEYEGYEQMRLNFTFDGEATDLGKIVNGQFVEDATDTDITGSNGAELKRQAGKYYALEFLDKLFEQDWVTANKDNLFGETYSHKNAQSAFLMSTPVNNKPIAMLAEGVWWEAEAKDTFTDMVNQYGEQNSASARNFGWMPLPKADQTKVGEKSVMYDIMYPIICVKNNMSDWQKEMAMDFLQFINTDEALQLFNEVTSVPRALKYEVTDFSNMTTYAKTLYNAKQNSDIVYPYARNDLFTNNQANFSEIGGRTYFSSVVADTSPAVSLYENSGVSAAQYFTGMYDRASKQSIWKDVVQR